MDHAFERSISQQWPQTCRHSWRVFWILKQLSCYASAVHTMQFPSFFCGIETVKHVPEMFCKSLVNLLVLHLKEVQLANSKLVFSIIEVNYLPISIDVVRGAPSIL